MKRVVLGVVLVAAGAALYGASGQTSAPPVPIESAVPDAPCGTPGPLGVRGDNVYECVGGYWRRLR
jgi:hypothetical protein